MHRLVMLAFVGPCPDGMEVCHKDGVSTNSLLSNLRYDTHVGNYVDAIRHGTMGRGVGVKLTREQVEKIREEYSCGGVTQRRLGELYGVYHATVGEIVRGEIW